MTQVHTTKNSMETSNETEHCPVAKQVAQPNEAPAQSAVKCTKVLLEKSTLVGHSRAVTEF